MPEKQRVVVHIMNREYPVLSTESAEYIRQLAGMVDQRMRQIALSAGFGTDRIAVLAALNLADELCKLQEQSAKERNELYELRRGLEKNEQPPSVPAQTPRKNGGSQGGNSANNGNGGSQNGNSKSRPRR